MENSANKDEDFGLCSYCVIKSVIRDKPESVHIKHHYGWMWNNTHTGSSAMLCSRMIGHHPWGGGHEEAEV